MWTTTGTRSSWWAPKTSRSAPWNRRTWIISARKGLISHTPGDDIMVYPGLSLVSLGCAGISNNKRYHSIISDWFKDFVFWRDCSLRLVKIWCLVFLSDWISYIASWLMAPMSFRCQILAALKIFFLCRRGGLKPTTSIKAALEVLDLI